MKYQKAIQITRHIEDIFRLPCVRSIVKLYLTDDFVVHLTDGAIASKGQWLCEGYDGKWTVTDEPPAL